MSKREYIVYDERAMQDTDDASIYVAGATTLSDALRDASDFTPCVIYSYELKGSELVNERFERYVS